MYVYVRAIMHVCVCVYACVCVYVCVCVRAHTACYVNNPPGQSVHTYTYLERISLHKPYA